MKTDVDISEASRWAFGEFSCGLCSIIADSVFPPLKDDYRLICVIDGTISAGTKTLGKGQSVILRKAANNIRHIEANKCEAYFLDFSGKSTGALLVSLMLETECIYDTPGDRMQILLERLADEFSLDIELGKEFVITSFIMRILTELSRCVHNISIPGNDVGIQGFSCKNIATITLGVFHGKRSVMIVPNTDMHGMVVLENYELGNYGIDLREYHYMQMSYYYESSGVRQNNASLRILNFFGDDNEYVSIYGGSELDNEFYAPLGANKWCYATFSLNYSEKIRQIINSHKEPVL